jgi:hypothetical protein
VGSLDIMVPILFFLLLFLLHLLSILKLELFT